jgi:3-deoxy-D-arabino-heptulosonate 7-phosphate (DAHP) synthase class II
MEFVAKAPTWQHEGSVARRRRLRKQAPPVLTQSEATMIRRTISRIERCVDLIVRRFGPGDRGEVGETLRVER